MLISLIRSGLEPQMIIFSNNGSPQTNDLEFKNSTGGGWISNSVWTLTIYP